MVFPVRRVVVPEAWVASFCLAGLLAGFVPAFAVDFLRTAFFRVAVFLLAAFLSLAVFFFTGLFGDLVFLGAAFRAGFFLALSFFFLTSVFFDLLPVAVLPITASIYNVVLIEAAIIPNVGGIFNRHNRGDDMMSRHFSGGCRYFGG